MSKNQADNSQVKSTSTYLFTAPLDMPHEVLTDLFSLKLTLKHKFTRRKAG